MAKYSRKAQSKVERAMHEMKEGKLTSGRSGRKVKNTKQAIAIGLSEARESGAKVPSNKGAKKRGRPEKKTGAKKSPAKRTATKKTAKKKSAGRPRKVGRPKKS